MSRTLSCALFDLDNTLTDRVSTIRQFSARFSEDFRRDLHEEVTFDDVHRVMDVGDGGGYRPKEVMFQEIQANLHWTEIPTINAISEYWYRVSAQCMQLRLGVHETLKELQRRDYQLGIITNGKTDVQSATIDAVNIKPYFSTIVISEASGFRKPDSRIFHLALSQLHVRPENAVYVGDHPLADVQGARDAGLQAIWFAGMHPWPQALTPPQHQITQIPQLLYLLGK